jgi:thiol-disulfide isomerase/thioredoxin
VVLVFTTTCPHCHSYMPIWKKLCATPGRQANMVSMEAATYDRTPLAEEKPVSGVPTVLFVDSEGRISEAEEPRNQEAMSAVLRSGSPAAAQQTPTEDMFEPVSEVAPPLSETAARLNAVVPGTEVMANPLSALPAQPVSDGTAVQAGGSGTTVQAGGSPWAAFLQAASAAAPAALLLGAYSTLPRRRRRTVTSSGLPPLRRYRRSRYRNTQKKRI